MALAITSRDLRDSSIISVLMSFRSDDAFNKRLNLSISRRRLGAVWYAITLNESAAMVGMTSSPLLYSRCSKSGSQLQGFASKSDTIACYIDLVLASALIASSMD